MFDEEDGIIHYEVESDDSIQEVSSLERPREVINELQVKPPVEPPQEPIRTTPTPEELQLTQQPQPVDEPLPNSFYSIFKKKQVPMLQKITSTISDEQLESLKLKKMQMPDNDVICQGTMNGGIEYRNEQLKKQKQWQLMVNHFANQPDFIEAALAFTQPAVPTPQVGMPTTTQSKKKGSKKVSFNNETTTLNHNIEYVSTSVVNPSLIRKQQEQQSQMEVESQQFQPPYATSYNLKGSIPLNQPSNQSINMQQASQQSQQFKYLNNSQLPQPRRETSPTMYRDMPTQQYVSPYQLLQGSHHVPSRQQPVFQKQNIEKELQYDINQSNKPKQQQQALRGQYPSVKTKQQQQSEIKSQSQQQIQPIFELKKQIMESVDFRNNMNNNMNNNINNNNQEMIESSQSGSVKSIIKSNTKQQSAMAKQIDKYYQHNDRQWKQINGVADIPGDFYMNDRFQCEIGGRNIDNTLNQLEVFKLLFSNNVYDWICEKCYENVDFEINYQIIDAYFACELYQLCQQSQDDKDKSKYSSNHILEEHFYRGIKSCLEQIDSYDQVLSMINYNFIQYYDPEEFLFLEVQALENHFIQELVLLDNAKGYILSQRYLSTQQTRESINEVMVEMIDNFKNKNHKLAINYPIHSLSILRHLKQHRIGCLGPYSDNELQVHFDDRILNQNHLLHYISKDEGIVLIIDKKQGMVSSFIDISLKFQHVNAQEIKGQKNEPFMQHLFNKFKQGVQKRRQATQGGSNIMVRLLNSAVFNASILFKFMHPDKISKQHLWFKEFQIDITHRLGKKYRVLQLQGPKLKQFSNRHTIIHGEISVNCIECGQQTKAMCQECSNIQQKLIGLCNTSQTCYNQHIQFIGELLSNQQETKQCTAQDAITKLNKYKYTLEQAQCTSEIQMAMEMIESTMDQLSLLNNEEQISMDLSKLLIQLETLIINISDRQAIIEEDSDVQIEQPTEIKTVVDKIPTVADRQIRKVMGGKMHVTSYKN